MLWHEVTFILLAGKNNPVFVGLFDTPGPLALFFPVTASDE